MRLKAISHVPYARVGALLVCALVTSLLDTQAASYPQQTIASFSPRSGNQGTVVALVGSGFSGSNLAWVGGAHGAPLKVVSDTRALVTIPAAADSGKIALLNPQHSSFSGDAFTVTGSKPIGGTGNSASAAKPGRATGVLSVRVVGNRLVDRSGDILQLRGVSYSGFESVAIQGWNPADPSGAQAGQAGGPSWPAIATWKANAVRLPLNEASWLGYTCTDSSGTAHNPDPGTNYKAAVKEQVKQANAAGLYVIVDLHWAAPGITCPMLQTQMADSDHSLDFWASIAETFKNNPAVLFELYNEPYMYGLVGFETDWGVLMRGGLLDYYPATDNAGHYKKINAKWKVAGMQAMLDTVRETGADNIVIVGCLAYNNDLERWLANMPTDSLNQLAAAWHPYPPVQQISAVSVIAGGKGYKVGDSITLTQPNTVYSPAILKADTVADNGSIIGASIVDGGSYLQTALPTGAVAQAASSGAGMGAAFEPTWVNRSSTWSMPVNWAAVRAISAKVPLIVTETGEHNQAGTVGAPFMQKLLPYADAAGWSVIGWTWNTWGNSDNVLITDAGGTPSAGYGMVFHDWMVSRGAKR